MAGATYAHLPERFRKMQQFRLAMIRREAQAVAFMERQWQFSITRLNKDIDSITLKIEQARRVGENVNPDWIRRQREYKRYQEQLIKEANRYSELVANRLARDVADAAARGARDTYAATQLSFAQPVRGLVTFGQLPERTILTIAGRVKPGTPTGRIIGSFGRDAARASRQVLIDGITRGRNVRVIARELKDAAGIPSRRAKTIARTEIFGAYRDSAVLQMQENKEILKGWIWFAQTNTACGGCLSRHGEVIKDVNTFMGAHVNCRCAPVPNPKTFAELGLDPSLDKLYPDPFSPDAMRADAQAQIDNATGDELSKRFGKGKAELLQSGQIELSDLGRQTNSKVWGEATVETPLRELIK